MANTIDSALTTDHRAKEMATTILQNRLAPLAAFTRQFSTKPLAPKATVQLEKVTAGGTAQTNATSFEDMTNFTGTSDNVPVTVAQITAGGHISNAERQGGGTLDNWLEIKLGEFGDKISDVITGLLLDSTFSVGVSSAAASFGQSELKTLWGAIGKASTKTIVLDSDLFANFLPATLQNFDPLTTGVPGWNHFLQQTRWTGATTDVAGFACSPTAIGVVSGLPETSPRAASMSQIGQIVLPGLGLTIQTTRWYSNVTRNDWFTFDVMFGAAVVDASALTLIKRL